MRFFIALLAATAALPSLAANPFSGYSAVVDPLAQTATFSIEYVTLPDLGSTVPTGQPVDSFVFWVDPDAPVALDRAQSHNNGTLPDSRQTFIASDTVPLTGQLQASWVQDNTTYTGPTGVGGWGSVQSYLDYGFVGNVLSFTVPLSLLQDTDGTFYYTLAVLHAGGTVGDTFGHNGVSVMASAVPEPETLWLMLAGLVGIGWYCMPLLTRLRSAKRRLLSICP
jgi:hypothetical protein